MKIGGTARCALAAAAALAVAAAAANAGREALATRTAVGASRDQLRRSVSRAVVAGSPRAAGGCFHNTLPDEVVERGSALYVLRALFARGPGGHPAGPCRCDGAALGPAAALAVTWMGHSSVLAEIDGRRVLFDPVWGERCSPFAFAGPQRLHPVPVPLAALGPVDVVVISHDHYDHLDLPTIRALAAHGHASSPCRSASARTWSAGACPRTGCASWTGTSRPRSPASPSPPPRPGTSAAAGCATRSTPCGPPGWSRAASTGSTTAATPATSPASRTSAPSTARSTPTMIQIGAYSDFWPDIHMTPEEGVRAHLDLQGGAARGDAADPLGHLQPRPAPVGRARTTTAVAAGEGRRAARRPEARRTHRRHSTGSGGRLVGAQSATELRGPDIGLRHQPQQTQAVTVTHQRAVG